MELVRETRGTWRLLKRERHQGRVGLAVVAAAATTPVRTTQHNGVYLKGTRKTYKEDDD